MNSTAIISADGDYRYRLGRVWDDAAGQVAFVMLNPSIADHQVDDPTIRRCVGFAKEWGYGGLIVVNLFAYRATKPERLFTASDPVGPDNDRHLVEAAGEANMVVCAWGAGATKMPGRVRTVREELQSALGRPLFCLGRTKDSHPRHPLYVRATQLPEVFL